MRRTASGAAMQSTGISTGLETAAHLIQILDRTGKIYIMDTPN